MGHLLKTEENAEVVLRVMYEIECIKKETKSFIVGGEAIAI